MVRFYNEAFLFLAKFLSAPAAFEEVAGMMAFRITETFLTVLTACPALANTCSVASPASSPNLLPNHPFYLRLHLYIHNIGVNHRVCLFFYLNCSKLKGSRCS